MRTFMFMFFVHNRKIKLTISQHKISSPNNKPLKPRKGVKVYLYSFFNLDARWGWVVKTMPQLRYTRERDPVLIVQEDG